MKKVIVFPFIFILLTCISFGCKRKTASASDPTITSTANSNRFYRAFSSQIAWGKHLVEMGGCSDCHTPYIMTKKGPVPDTAMYLAGHPAKIPTPQVNREKIERKGLVVTRDETAWVGPWGITYSANLTPDKKTGIGSWTEAQFIRCFKLGKANGSPQARPLLPPMNGVAAKYNHIASDKELKAIFTYLQTIKPVSNNVPAPVPPMMARRPQ